MMYLSRIELDTARRSTMRALSMPNLLHGAVESAFSGGRERRLWRLDTLRGRQYLLLVSAEQPSLSALDAQFGTGTGWETRSYAPLLARAEKHGFALEADQFGVVSNKWYSFRKHGERRVSLLAVTYEGVLRVTDAALFRRTLTEGIGRGKAYGMGLLTVMRAPEGGA